MSDLGAFAFAIRADAPGWRWRAVQHDGHVKHGSAPTRAAAAACVIRVLAESHLQRSRREPGGRG
jgi:hypothetical protein